MADSHVLQLKKYDRLLYLINNQVFQSIVMYNLKCGRLLTDIIKKNFIFIRLKFAFVSVFYFKIIFQFQKDIKQNKKVRN